MSSSCKPDVELNSTVQGRICSSLLISISYAVLQVHRRNAAESKLEQSHFTKCSAKEARGELMHSFVCMVFDLSARRCLIGSGKDRQGLQTGLSAVTAYIYR